MKVLWFTNTAASASEILKNPGLGGGWLSALDKILSKHCELSVAFYYERFSKKFKYKGIYYYPICSKNWRLNLIKNKFKTKFIDSEDFEKYLEIINDVNPDIIHIHGTENPFACIIDKVTIPVIVSIQGNITVYHYKYFSGIEKKYAIMKFPYIKKLSSFPFYVSYYKDYKLFCKMREREIKNLLITKYIIGRTDWDRRITQILAPTSTYFIGQELLREVFYDKLWKPVKHSKLILHTTSSPSFYKGFETLCHCLSLLNNLKIDVEWRVAGISEKDILNKIVMKKLGNSYPKKGLVLLGGLNENILVEKLLEANIYIMTSHIENSPNNLCEAMILGMPCIATYAGGTATLLKDGIEGILIQDGDPWSMAGAIMEMLNNYTQAISYGKQARLAALKRHNSEKVITDLLICYQQIITK